MRLSFVFHGRRKVIQPRPAAGLLPVGGDPGAAVLGF